MNNLVWQESDFQWLEDEKSLDKHLSGEKFEIKNADIALSVKAIILDEFGRLLLLQNNPEITQFEFDLPGGHVDPVRDTGLTEALARELKEETNLDLEEAKQFNTETEVKIGEDNHPCLFFKVTASGPIKTSEEYLGYSWIFPDDLDMLDLGAFKELLKEFFSAGKDVEKYNTFTAHPIADIIAPVEKEEEIEKSRDGGIIALVPVEEIAKQLEAPNGIPWNEMHITLAYIKYPWTSDPTKIVKDLDTPKFEGRISGYEKFEDALVALIDVPGLDNWRTQLTGKLIDVGFSLGDFYSFKPHITLAYLDKEQEYMVDYSSEVSEEFSKIPIIFKSIEVWKGEDKKVIVALNVHDEENIKKSDFSDAYTTEIYQFIDLELEKAGMKIPGKIQRNAKQTGREIEYELYRSLSEEVKDFLDSLDGTEPPEKVLEGVREALKQWQLRALPMADAAFTRLFTQGFQAGALSAGVSGKLGSNDVNALKILQQGKYRIGERIVLFGDEETKEFQKVIWNAYEPDGTFDLSTITNGILDKVKEDRWKIDRVVRTETSQVSAIGRLWAWEQDPGRFGYRYDWSSVPDSRRKAISKWRSEEGPYSHPEIKFLWLNQDEFRDGRWHASSFNCRCTITRYPIDEEWKTNRFEGQEGRFRNTANVIF